MNRSNSLTLYQKSTERILHRFWKGNEMSYKIALVQANFQFGELAANLEKAERMIRDAAEQGANIVCLPESFNQGYSGEHMAELVCRAEYEDGDTLQRMCALAKELRIYLIAPIFIKYKDGHCNNSAFLISQEGTIIGSYAKTHLIECEKGEFEAGNQYPVFETKYGRVGILICNDLCFVESARMLGARHADIIFVCAAWRFLESSYHWWEQMLRGHALNNQVFVAAVNRVGPADDKFFAGETMVIGPDGFIKQKLLFPEERLLVQEISLDEIHASELANISILKDRKPTDYKQLCVPVQ